LVRALIDLGLSVVGVDVVAALIAKAQAHDGKFKVLLYHGFAAGQ
jgi:hypothetical protein